MQESALSRIMNAVEQPSVKQLAIFECLVVTLKIIFDVSVVNENALRIKLDFFLVKKFFGANRNHQNQNKLVTWDLRAG